MGLNGYVLLLLASVVGSGFSTSVACIRECPQDCGQKEKPDGCLECICDQPFFPVPPPLPPRPTNPNDDPCPTTCPQDCGQTRQPNGCLKCQCGANPFFKPTPRPPSKSRRESDTSLCSTKCPQDCGCTITNGEAECDCTAGPNHPLIKPPPPPRRPRYSIPTPTVDDGTLCRQKCPADCGCTVEAGEAKCHCTAENHPLIKKPPPPPPPRPVLPPAENDAVICGRACPADCGCTVNAARVAECHCTAENHPLIPKPLPPTPHPPPEKSGGYEDDGTICRQKCPADCGCTVNKAREAQCECTAENHPLIKPPPPPPPPRKYRQAPMIACSPPKCDAPCKIKYDSVCPYCKCPFSY